jgi:hypothetical protein
LDLALDLGARSPGRISNPAEFLHAHVARASLALARRESGQAEALLARALRYDPTLTLSADESSPRVRVVFDEARRSLGPRPTLAPELLGDLGEGRVLVGRAAASGQLEYFLVEDGRVMAATIGDDDAQALHALDGGARVSPKATMATMAPARGPAADVASPATTRAARPRRRAWLWALVPVGAIVVTGVVVLSVLLTRPSEPSAADWNVVPHF